MRREPASELPYLRWGVGAGALGAALDAAVFGAIDLQAGRPGHERRRARGRRRPRADARLAGLERLRVENHS